MLHVLLAYAVAGHWAVWPMALNAIATLGVFMFIAAFDDYWDYRTGTVNNFLTKQIDRDHFNPNQALFWVCAPLALTVPLFVAAHLIGVAGGIISLALGAAIALIVFYAVPPLRWKERFAGSFVAPALVSIVFLESVSVVAPVGLFVVLLSALLFLFQWYAEMLHVIDIGLQGQPKRGLSLPVALKMLRGLPVLSCLVSASMAFVNPIFLVTTCGALTRWLAVRRLPVEVVPQARRNLLNPVWSLWEFAVYALVSLWGGGRVI